MFDNGSSIGVSPQRRRGDAGMTLPEVLIAITVLGMIMAVLSSAVIVTLRQQSSTEGRLNVARSEQSVGMWLPGDLASAGVVSVEPDWSPCGHIEVDGSWEPTGAECPPIGLPAGSNALMLGWSFTDGDGNVTYTNVSYQFYQDADGTFSLARVECVLSAGAWSCSHIVVLRELASPPAGTPWVPGETRPFWVIEVSEPLAAAATSEEEFALGETKNAKRVIVTINGGGAAEGAGGGVNRISITAGGTTRRVIEGSSMVGAPSFVEARSLCGGPMTLLIDESNSIGREGSGGSTANVNNVKQGVRNFVTALAGTPVKLQVIGFHTFSHALGTTQWHRYFDMANDAEVAELLAAINTLRFDWSTAGNANGGTNWEEGLFRAFYTQQGLTAEPVPNKVVFFTDGIPTFDRLVYRTGDLPADPPDPGPAWADSTGSAYSQVAFNRADFIAREFRGPIDLIGVGVGGIASGTESWVSSPRVGYREVWYRSYRQYQSYGFQTNRQFQRASGFQSNLDFERASQYMSKVRFQTRSSSTASWKNVLPTVYHNHSPASNKRIYGTRKAYEVTKAEHDAYRGMYGTPAQWYVNSWTDTTPTSFYAGDVDGQGDADGWRIGPSTTYRSVTEAEYESFRSAQPTRWKISSWSDTTPTDYFGGQPTRPDKYRIGTSTTWRSVTPQEYELHNTTSDSSDGWRVGTSMTWVTKAEYDANNTTPDGSDGWTALSAPEYVAASSGTDWVEWPGPRSGINSDQLDYREIENVPPYDGYRPVQTVPVARADILARLIGEAVPPTRGPDGEYDNAKQATLYTTPDWTQLPKALKAIALGDCGGTLTLQTRLGSSGAPDPFRYQATQQFAADGTELVTDRPVVYTNREQTTGNFDLAINSGLYRDVVIMPENYSDLRSYQPTGWTCRAGAEARPFELVDIPGGVSSPWKGIKVRVAANEAVSCIQTVTR